MTKQEVSLEVRTGSGNEPPWWANRTGRTLISIIDVCPSSKRQSTLYSGWRVSLCLWHCCEKKKVATRLQKLSPLLSILSSPSCCHLTLYLLIPAKPCGFPLACLLGIFTVGFLCFLNHWPKCCCVAKTGPTHKHHQAVRWIDEPPDLGFWTNVLPSLSLGRKCSSKGSWQRALLPPEDCVGLLWTHGYSLTQKFLPTSGLFGWVGS